MHCASLLESRLRAEQELLFVVVCGANVDECNMGVTSRLVSMKVVAWERIYRRDPYNHNTSGRIDTSRGFITSSNKLCGCYSFRSCDLSEE